ncbi:FKBP-type peptidyl-prolyl cis-trans isomerase [Aliagarivorans marinus]|uniref:FKBP-type peptidyl-prolyl cis-trans isomerase n=1 Tax=Aliagarivorans marinus TaxID=561965 RepID=UPI00040D0E9B|nr:FKBP-type peptidyl-prolyl cis-trans isomerase [Aliagarivorans marinus]
MKKYFAFSLLAASVALAGCQQQAQEEVKPVSLDTPEQQQAYAIGASVSRYIGRSLEQQQELGLELDNALVLRGMQDGLDGEVAMSEEQMQEALQALDATLAGLAQEKAAEEAAAMLAENEKFLAENAEREEVSVTESGLQYEVLTAAKGDKPAAEDMVTVHYVGSLLDGTEFDSSIARGEPTSFPLNRVIPGWTEGVQLMSVGSKYKFYIPSELGYGEMGAGSIPPNSVLVFEVELLEFEKAEAVAETQPE